MNFVSYVKKEKHALHVCCFVIILFFQLLRRMMIFQSKIINIVLCVNAYNGGRDVSKEFSIGSYNDRRTGWTYRALAPFVIIQDDSSNRINTALLQATSDKDSARTFVLDAFNSISKIVRFTSHYLVQMSRFLESFLLIGWTRVKLAWRIFLVADCRLPFGELARIFCNVSPRTNRMLAAGLAFLSFIQLTAA